VFVVWLPFISAAAPYAIIWVPGIRPPRG
jgi:hypothetical protein